MKSSGSAKDDAQASKPNVTTKRYSERKKNV